MEVYSVGGRAEGEVFWPISPADEATQIKGAFLFRSSEFQADGPHQAVSPFLEWVKLPTMTPNAAGSTDLAVTHDQSYGTTFAGSPQRLDGTLEKQQK